MSITMQPNTLALHPHERTALARGSVLLLRPVEPQPPANIALILPPPSRRVLDHWPRSSGGAAGHAR